MTDQPTPSRRASLRDEIANALEAADYRHDMRRGDLADSVMPVLDREWPWLRAEAEEFAPASGPAAVFINTVADIIADHEGDEWADHSATRALRAAITRAVTPTEPAATKATGGWEQQDDGTWTLPVDGGTILFTRRTTAEERARFAATWKPPAAVPRFTAHPVTPDMEAAATARAIQAAEDSERSAAWSAKHCAPDARTDQLQQRIHELESHARDANRLRTDWTAMRNRAEQAEQQRDQYAALVRDFLDPDPCQFDHHGYCQAHAAGLGGEPMSCPHRRAREVLAELDSAALNPQEPTP